MRLANYRGMLILVALLVSYFSSYAAADVDPSWTRTNVTTTGNDLWIKNGVSEWFNFSVYINATDSAGQPNPPFYFTQINISVPVGFNVSMLVAPDNWRAYNRSLNTSANGANGGNATFENMTTGSELNEGYSLLFSMKVKLNDTNHLADGNYSFTIYSKPNSSAPPLLCNVTVVRVTVDNHGPNITAINDSGPPVDVNGTLTVRVNVSENWSKLDTVFIEYNRINHTMINDHLRTFNWTINFTSESIPAGNLSYIIYANDTLNNWNRTERRYIDVRGINVTLKWPDDGATIQEGEVIDLDVSGLGLHTVWYNNDTSASNTTNYTLKTALLATDYNISTRGWSTGPATLRVWANDSNKQEYKVFYFTVARTTSSIAAVTKNETWVYVRSAIDLRVNLTTFNNLSWVEVNVTHPGGYVESLTRANFSYFVEPMTTRVVAANFTNTSFAGTYSVRAYINDSRANTAYSTTSFYVFNPATHWVNVTDGGANLTIYYYRASDWLALLSNSSTGMIRTTVPDVVSNLYLSANDSTFRIELSNINVSYVTNISVRARDFNCSNLSGFHSKYTIRDAYAFEIANSSDISSSYTAKFFYSGVNDANKLNVAKGIYGFSAGDRVNATGTFYNRTSTDATLTLDTSSSSVSLPVSGFSSFVLLEDNSTEVCSDNIDNDYDGNIDEDCSLSSASGTGSGGGETKGNATESRTGEKKYSNLYESSTTLKNRIQANSKLESIMEDLFGKIFEESDVKDVATTSAQTSDKVSATREFDSSTEGRTEVVLSVKYDGIEPVKTLMIYDEIPKDFAPSASDIVVKSSGKVKVVEEDPSYLISFSDVTKDKSLTVQYVVNKNLNKTVLDKMSKPTIFASTNEMNMTAEETPAINAPEEDTGETEASSEEKQGAESAAGKGSGSQAGTGSSVFKIIFGFIIAAAVVGLVVLYIYNKRASQSPFETPEEGKEPRMGSGDEEEASPGEGDGAALAGQDIASMERKRAFEKAEGPGDSDLERIVSYVRENSPQGREILTKSLSQAGYDPDIVEEALDQVFGAPRASRSAVRPEDAEQISQIVEYLEHYRNFTPEKLRASLVSAGYDPVLIDAEIAKRFRKE